MPVTPKAATLKPKAFVLDVDGVMTDGKFYYTSEGKQMKVFGADDHDALCLLKPYLEIHFITGDKRGYPISEARIVKDMHMSLQLVSTVNRIDWIRERWDPSQVIYMGDGLLDHQVFVEVGYAIAPANADRFCKSCAHYVTERSGGDRAVAEASVHILTEFFGFDFRTQQLPSDLQLSGQWSVGGAKVAQAGASQRSNS